MYGQECGSWEIADECAEGWMFCKIEKFRVIEYRSKNFVICFFYAYAVSSILKLIFFSFFAMALGL
jgi:hypothetical protein